MKKISYILTAACALWAFSSCCADKDPMYHRAPEGSFVLNEPVLQDQYIDLTPGNTIELVASQPDYGYSAVAQYSAQMALDESFTHYYDLAPISATSAKMSYKQEDIASGFCELMGIKGDDADAQYEAMFPDGAPYTTIYFRAICQLQQVPGSAIISNVVAYNYIKPYFSVAVPGFLYLIGTPQSPVQWDINSGALALKEEVIGSKIYIGKFDIPAGEQIFRFYTELGDWGKDGELPSVGSGPEDNTNVPVEFVDGTYTGKAVPGKGSWKIADWGGGEINMVVNMSDANNITVTFSSGEIFVASEIYVVGNYAGDWIAPDMTNISSLPKLLNSAGAENIYTGSLSFDGPKDLWFRFATKLSEGTGWEGSETIGWQEPDQGSTFQLTNNAFHGTFVQPGSGSWNFDLPVAGTFNMVVDFDKMTVDYTFEEAAAE